jgi:hypothetical protein
MATTLIRVKLNFEPKVMGSSNNLDPLFFLSHLVFHTILSFFSCLFAYACIFLFLVLSCCCMLLSFYRFCYLTLPRHLAIVVLPCYMPHIAIVNYFHSTLLLLRTPFRGYYKLHLVVATSSTLLHVLLCYCYSTIVVTLPAFLPCRTIAQPCCFSTFVVSLFASGTNGIT